MANEYKEIEYDLGEAIKRVEQQLRDMGVSDSSVYGVTESDPVTRIIIKDLNAKLAELRTLSPDLKYSVNEKEQGENPTFFGVEGYTEFNNLGTQQWGKLIPQGSSLSSYTPIEAAQESFDKSLEYGNDAERALKYLRANLIGAEQRGETPKTGSNIRWEGKSLGATQLIELIEKKFNVDLGTIDVDKHVEGTEWTEITDLLVDQAAFAFNVGDKARSYIVRTEKAEVEFDKLATQAFDLTESLSPGISDGDTKIDPEFFSQQQADKRLGRLTEVVEFLGDEALAEISELDPTGPAGLLVDGAAQWAENPENPRNSGLVSSREIEAEEEAVPVIGEPRIEDAEIAALPQPDVSVEEEAFLDAEILGETPLTQAEMDADRLANADAFAAADASMLPELSEVGGGPSTIPAGDGVPGGGPSTPEGFTDQLDAIGDSFDVAAQFGYRFFFFKPGTDEPREDMMISDQVILDRLGLDEPINVLEYIKVKGLTNPREIQAAFAETQWFKDTNETMQAFDLEWDAAAASGALNDDFTLRRREIVKTELDYISSQLEALGLSDEMTEAQQLSLAKTAKRTGMSLQDIRQTLSSVETDYLDFASFTGADGAGTGLLGTYETSIKNMASQYMIGVDEEALDTYVMGVYQSDNPEQNLLLLREQLAETAKSRFPTLGGLIDRGMTPAQYFAPYSSKASALLERPVDFMGADEGLFNQIASGMPDNETGSRTMTFTESNELIRGTAEWQTTKNANDEARTIADDVGRMFGFVA
jgi:hypothetical protein|tara:strand:- start:238 stop:2523 length:2286 start_codon:yes stop_codon:yes gene_type:complete